MGCTDKCKRVCTESWLWEKSPLPHRGIEPASAEWWSDALTNWATPPAKGSWRQRPPLSFFIPVNSVLMKTKLKRLYLTLWISVFLDTICVTLTRVTATGNCTRTISQLHYSTIETSLNCGYCNYVNQHHCRIEAHPRRTKQKLQNQVHVHKSKHMYAKS